MTSGGRNSDARIRRTTRREPPPVADGDGAHDNVTITISETELDTFDGSHTSRRTTLEKRLGLKVPQDSAHSRPARATSLHHSGDHNARLGSRDRVGKSFFIGGRHKPHVAGHFSKDHPNRAGTVRIRMDKKRQSAELDLEDQDDETDVVIPLGRKRATIHLAQGALHRPSQSNGPGNGAVLSADAIASHLASEFSLSPMRIDSIVSDVSRKTLPLASFWPKPTRSPFSMESIEECKTLTLPAATLAKWRAGQRRADIDTRKFRKRRTKGTLYVDMALMTNKSELKHATLPKRPKLNIAPGDYYCAPDKTFEPGPRKGSLGPGAATASIEAVKRVMHPERVALITAAVATPLYSNPNHRSHLHIRDHEANPITETSDHILVTLQPKHLVANSSDDVAKTSIRVTCV